jgi:RES domain-containing protein
MRSFSGALDYMWFKQGVIEDARYRHDAKQEKFLKTVQETGQKRMIVLPAGAELYRAQLGGRTSRGGIKMGTRYMSVEDSTPFLPERMTPEPRSAKEGRVNPKGLPCLYLADRPKTAMSEVRPWKGAHVSIGHFRTVKDLTLMDCAVTKEPRWVRLGEVVTDEDKEQAGWRSIADAFSEPVTDSDMKADYAPTQILAEVFKQMGCDGIKYKSVVGEGGHSYALFDLKSAKLFRCAVCKTEDISHEFSAELRPYEIDSEGKLVEVEEHCEDEDDWE